MDLEQRLARLERGNRWMKRIGALVLVVAAAALLSEMADGKALPDLEVESLALKDKDGKTRAQLAMVDGTPSLALFDKAGETRVWGNPSRFESGLSHHAVSHALRGNRGHRAAGAGLWRPLPSSASADRPAPREGGLRQLGCWDRRRRRS